MTDQDNPFRDPFTDIRVEASPARASAADEIIAQNKAQVREVTSIMQKNIERALERDQSLHDVDTRTNQLELGAGQFAVTSNQAHNKYLWKNRKWTVILGSTIVGIIVIALVGVLIAVEYNNTG
jgi:hypothetical protein